MSVEIDKNKIGAFIKCQLKSGEVIMYMVTDGCVIQVSEKYGVRSVKYLIRMPSEAIKMVTADEFNKFTEDAINVYEKKSKKKKNAKISI